MELSDVETFEKQQKILDSWAKTELTDVEKVKQELNFLLDVKREKFYSDIAFFQKKYCSLILLSPDAFKFAITVPTVELDKIDQLEDSPVKAQFDAMVGPKGLDRETILNLVIEICKNRKNSEEELREMAKTDCVYLYSSFPKLLNIAISYEIDRQSEFRELSTVLLERIRQKQNNEITQEQLSKGFLQQTLTDRFYTRK